MNFGKKDLGNSCLRDSNARSKAIQIAEKNKALNFKKEFD